MKLKKLSKVEVSLIIPIYNRVQYIGETLDSIIGQNFKEWECIVVDDASTDHIDELMEFYSERDSRIHFHKRPPHLPKGANACRNYGFSISRGKYINWFDSDDIMQKNFIEKKFASFEEGILLVVSKGYLTDERLNAKSKMEINPNISIFKGIVTWENQIITNSVMFRRSFLENRKLFKEDIHKAQEAEFFSRLFFKLPGENYRILQEPLFFYRLHKGSSTIKNKDYIKEYKGSESFLAIENLKRSIELKDLELINHLYLKLLFLYFAGLDHKDQNNSRFILKNLILYLPKVDLKLSLLIGQLIFFPGITGKRSYNLERKLRLYKID